jgi:hypothetical protein
MRAEVSRVLTIPKPVSFDPERVNSILENRIAWRKLFSDKFLALADLATGSGDTVQKDPAQETQLAAWVLENGQEELFFSYVDFVTEREGSKCTSRDDLEQGWQSFPWSKKYFVEGFLKDYPPTRKHVVRGFENLHPKMNAEIKRLRIIKPDYHDRPEKYATYKKIVKEVCRLVFTLIPDLKPDEADQILKFPNSYQWLCEKVGRKLHT